MDSSLRRILSQIDDARHVLLKRSGTDDLLRNERSSLRLFDPVQDVLVHLVFARRSFGCELRTVVDESVSNLIRRPGFLDPDLGEFLHHLGLCLRQFLVEILAGIVVYAHASMSKNVIEDGSPDLHLHSLVHMTRLVPFVSSLQLKKVVGGVSEPAFIVD